MSAYLTFDIGTTALKTALINESGRILELRSIEYTPQTPRTGWAEMAADSYWQAAVEGTRTVFAASSTAPAALAAVGFSSRG